MCDSELFWVRTEYVCREMAGCRINISWKPQTQNSIDSPRWGVCYWNVTGPPQLFFLLNLQTSQFQPVQMIQMEPTWNCCLGRFMTLMSRQQGDASAQTLFQHCTRGLNFTPSLTPGCDSFTCLTLLRVSLRELQRQPETAWRFLCVSTLRSGGVPRPRLAASRPGGRKDPVQEHVRRVHGPVHAVQTGADPAGAPHGVTHHAAQRYDASWKTT